jgi:hypothetical protein
MIVTIMQCEVQDPSGREAGRVHHGNEELVTSYKFIVLIQSWLFGFLGSLALFRTKDRTPCLKATSVNHLLPLRQSMEPSPVCHT